MRINEDQLRGHLSRKEGDHELDAFGNGCLHTCGTGKSVAVKWNAAVTGGISEDSERTPHESKGLDAESGADSYVRNPHVRRDTDDEHGSLARTNPTDDGRFDTRWSRSSGRTPGEEESGFKDYLTFGDLAW